MVSNDVEQNPSIETVERGTKKFKLLGECGGVAKRNCKGINWSCIVTGIPKVMI
jgi:hypothetical protein